MKIFPGRGSWRARLRSPSLRSPTETPHSGALLARPAYGRTPWPLGVATAARETSRATRCRPIVRCGVLLFVIFLFLAPAAARADVLDDLRDKLFERRQQLQAIEARIEQYRKEVSERQQQATTLRGQVRVIEQNVTALTLEIDKTAVEIEEVIAESAAVAEEIRVQEEGIAKKREQLRELVRLLQALEADSGIEAFFKYPSLTGALVEQRAVTRVQQRTHEALNGIKELRAELKKRSEALRDLERELAELHGRQEAQKKTLEDQQAAKSRLLEITKAQEQEFQKLLNSAAAEHRRAQAQISSIESEVRAELARRGITRLGGVGIFDWPLDPIFGISCGFHCPDYPFRSFLGPHTGIDIPTHMGTAVRAGADGYVARARDAGGPGYSYVLILHGDDFSTVYGHLSSISASDGQFVSRGQVIGATGGAPGSRGAGLSTGPHLHFEVRKSGNPVNPAPYLP